MTDLFGAFPAFRAFLGDVRDVDRLRQACQGVDVVVAAAALKRVDATAYNPSELIKTNVLGVENTIRAAVDAKVKKVIVVSSDKCVAPTTPYGVSKAMAETTAVYSNTWAYPQGTKVAAVRYGNVLASRGSVIYRWRDQVARGAAVTLTDPRMSRFIMTIEDAVAVVVYAINEIRGGEVVVPVLASATLGTLADAVAPGYPVEVVGLRPGGEKLAESLLADDEIPRTRRAGRYFIVTPASNLWHDESWYGEPVEADFVYRSDQNTDWLSVAEVRALLAVTEAAR